MGYRDDFYTVDNVIGYSGTLTDFPSVYFQSESEFGHITQKHGDSQNVGRGHVESSEGYSIGNEMTEDGVLKLKESLGGQSFHTSRSVLTSLEGMSEGDKAIVYQAIWKYQEEKQITWFAKKDFQIIDKAHAVHKLAMHEIRKAGRKKKKS